MRGRQTQEVAMGLIEKIPSRRGLLKGGLAGGFRGRLPIRSPGGVPQLPDGDRNLTHPIDASRNRL